MYDFPCIMSLGLFASVTAPVLQTVFIKCRNEGSITGIGPTPSPTLDKRLGDYSLEKENGSREKTLRR